MKIEPINTLEEILPLLANSALETKDIEETGPQFFGVRVAGALVAVVGFEAFPPAGLLRSLAVSSEYQGRGLARQLVDFVEDWARSQGIESMFLLTTTAEQFFSKLGYAHSRRQSAPLAIQETAQFSKLCPAESAFMVKNL